MSCHPHHYLSKLCFCLCLCLCRDCDRRHHLLHRGVMALIAGTLLPTCRRSLMFQQAHSSPPTSSSNHSDHHDGSSYLSMWKRAKERQEQEQLRFHRGEEKSHHHQTSLEHEQVMNGREEKAAADWEKRAQRFENILRVPSEERDKVQRMQVIDRATAALAAVNALRLKQESTFRNSAATLPPSYAQSISHYNVMKGKEPAVQGMDYFNLRCSFSVLRNTVTH